VFQVESAYLNVLRNEQLVKVDEENLKRDRRQLERITESNRVGALSLADVYRQQSQVAADELTLITDQNNFDKAKADLLALIGLDVSQEYTFIDPTISPELSSAELDSTLNKYRNFKEISERAMGARPDYLSAQEAVHSAESGVSVARSRYFPWVGASVNYGLSNTELATISENKSLSWGLNFRWTLFDGFSTNQSLQTAAMTKRNAELSLVQAERDINVQLKKALLDLEAVKKQYEVSQKGLTSATEDRKIAEERYNLGAGTLLDLLTANAGLVQAEANKVNAVYNYIIAKRNIEYAIGERVY
jgi:outer membrane protein